MSLLSLAHGLEHKLHLFSLLLSSAMASQLKDTWQCDIT